MSTRVGGSDATDSALTLQAPGIVYPWLLVFDLDGTLIDSSQDLCRSVNAALCDVGLESLTELEIAGFIGDGARLLVERALAHASARSGVKQDPRADASRLVQCLTFFLAYYQEHKLDNTRPYPGVPETLRTIRYAFPSLPMAVLTNKPVKPSRELCNALGLSSFFFANYGGDSFPTKKPAPEGLQEILREAEDRFPIVRAARAQNPHGAMMVGDSPVDMEVARACGFRAVGCSYGLAPEALQASYPDATIAAPQDLLTLLKINRAG